MPRTWSVLLMTCLWSACGDSDKRSIVPDASPDLAEVGSPADGAIPTPDAALPEAGPTCDGPNQVAVAEGCLEGEQQGEVFVFRGIPFAAPPVGSLRWRPPRPADPWQGVREARAFGKACPQASALISGQALESSEDCLTLNIWTPNDAAAREEAKLPVMVWIHGGGLQNGSGAQPIYDGRYLAGRGQVVLVTINYRLAQLGYLAHPAMSAEDAEHGVSGNYGLRDQLAALEWVRDNAARFGGDPSTVTIFGESAGGMSVCALLASPLAAGLFHRAVIQSAACSGYTGNAKSSFARPLALGALENGAGGSAEAQGLRFGEALGCPGDDAEALDCMRNKPVAEVIGTLKAMGGLFGQGERYGFAVDGRVLEHAPAAASDQGKANQVPVMLGTTANEVELFTSKVKSTTEAQLEAAVGQAFGATAVQQVLAVYPTSAYPSHKATLDDIYSDAIFVCPVRERARVLAAQLPGKVFLFQFSHVTALWKNLGMGAPHTAELEFVFGTLRQRKHDKATAAELALSDAMLGYWANFARTGDPNSGGLAVEPTWPAYDNVGDAHLQLKIPIASGTGLKQPQCDLLETFLK